MADQNDLNKPDLISNYSSEVLQTIRGHITRLWTGDYTGMGGLVANMRRWVDLGDGNLRLTKRNIDGSETSIFDTSAFNKKSNNLSDLGSIPLARSNLELGSSDSVLHKSVSDEYGNLRSIPQIYKTSSYTLTASDSGKHLVITSGGVFVPANILNVGSVVTIYNGSSSAQQIRQQSGLTLRWAGRPTTTNGDRTIAGYGISTILFISSNEAVISGSGLA